MSRCRLDSLRALHVLIRLPGWMFPISRNLLNRSALRGACKSNSTTAEIMAIICYEFHHRLGEIETRPEIVIIEIDTNRTATITNKRKATLWTHVNKNKQPRGLFGVELIKSSSSLSGMLMIAPEREFVKREMRFHQSGLHAVWNALEEDTCQHFSSLSTVHSMRKATNMGLCHRWVLSVGACPLIETAVVAVLNISRIPFFG